MPKINKEYPFVKYWIDASLLEKIRYYIFKLRGKG